MKKLILTFPLLMAAMCIVNGQSFNTGEKVWAYEDADFLWYKATIVDAGSESSKIHWEGFSSDNDETLENWNFWKSGMHFIKGDYLQALETDGKWYNAKVIQVNDETNRYLIDWGGFGEEYDRWIGYDSLRLPTKENYISEGNFRYPNSTSNGGGGGSGCAGSYRISVVYIYNQTGATLKYSIQGDGASYSGSVYNNQKGNITCCPYGYDLYINGQSYITISQGHDGQTITVK